MWAQLSKLKILLGTEAPKLNVGPLLESRVSLLESRVSLLENRISFLGVSLLETGFPSCKQDFPF